MPLDVAVQAPPNLAHAEFPRLLEAGIDDFGGVSPVTPDHVNPEAPWPERSLLARRDRRSRPHARAAARHLSRATCAMPSAGWRRPCAVPRWRRRTARDWRVTRARGSPAPARSRRRAWQGGRRPRLAGSVSAPFFRALDRSERGADLDEADAVALLSARARRSSCWPARPTRAAPSVGRQRHLRRLPEHQLHQRLLLPLRLLRILEGAAGRQPARACLPARRRRGRAALRRGVGSRRHRGLPAGRHPPGLHGHLVPRPRARDPRGAARPARARLLAARGLAGRGDRGLDAARLPRAAARRRARQPAGHRGRDPGRRGAQILCPDKLRTDQWLEVMRTAHASACARRRRSCSATSRRRSTRPGTSSRSATCSARPAASPSSCRCRSCTRRRRSRSRGWPATAPRSARPSCSTRPPASCSTATCRTSRRPGSSSGPTAPARSSHAGVNDLGGTLMNESISRAAGASHGQECPPERMEQVIRAAGREPVQRTTLYGRADAGRVAASFAAAPLAPADPRPTTTVDCNAPPS